MFVAIKSINSHAYELNTKRIELKGGCHLNEITADDFNALRNKYACIDEFIEKGFYIVSKSKNANTEAKASDETLQSIKDNQENTIKANESRTRAKIVKG